MKTADQDPHAIAFLAKLKDKVFEMSFSFVHLLSLSECVADETTEELEHRLSTFGNHYCQFQLDDALDLAIKRTDKDKIILLLKHHAKINYARCSKRDLHILLKLVSEDESVKSHVFSELIARELAGHFS